METPEEMRSAALFARRRVLTVTAAAATLAFTTNLPSAHAAESDAKSIKENPFTLGVASGDPLSDSVVLWTRLAPKPFEVGGGMAPGTVNVRWQLAHDEQFRTIAKQGITSARPEFHHTVHVDVPGLDADRVYFYRFVAGDWQSPTGRTRTAPAVGAGTTDMRFGLLSCQAFQDGYYTSLRHLAAEDLDAVFHVGDYIYESRVNAAGGSRALTTPLPAVFDHEIMTLDDYRLRYALYKSDPDLQAAHAAFPWYVTWDDHEVENNYAGAISENEIPEADFLIRRAAAYRAYWENQPLRRPQLPDGPDMQLYRRFRHGRLAEFNILDTRQFRSNQANGDGAKLPNDESRDPSRTLPGLTQERWLIDGLSRSRARWNVIPQQVTFSQRKFQTAEPSTVSMDAWDGYPASRERILAGIEQAGVENVVVLTGDVHVHYGFDIKRNFDDPNSRTLGVEVVGTSVATGGNGTAKPASFDTQMAANPHMKFFNGQRGYVMVTLDDAKMTADFKVVDRVTTPGGGVSTAASMVSEAGDPGLRPA